ncbi:hypothetical protein PVL29_004326 [Vitis rotundifolia]|uniref:Uncharacterized protein n=1 Tax=Vitis rotundifolia TaxID=103349 RepID=A0AA39DZG9_VITRO|nr:hypothetical protein PVL29_004326 [Vitis rotundifolia]
MELVQRSAAKIQRKATTISLQDNTSGEAGKEDHASHEMLNESSKEVATSLQGRLDKLTSLSTACCIYRVPQKLRKVNMEAYTPRVVSIGPLHHGEEHLVAMEEHKLRYLQNFLSKSRKTLEECVEIISREEKSARDCYTESINMSSKEFVEMILLDGCFIVEVILYFCNRHTIKPDDRVYKKPWLFFDVRGDMTLLENQLPFSLLQILYNLALPGHENDCSFLTSSIEFFEDYLQMSEIKREMNESVRKISSTYKVEHFVDLLRVFQLPSSLRSSRDQSNKRINTLIRTATQLREAGVSFKLGSEDKPLLDIHYRDGVLEIPKLILGDRGESLFRNLIAFGQCHYLGDTYITDYIHLMDHLINTSKDVDILVNEGIIDNWLGDNVAVTDLFNNLLINAALWGDNFYFEGIFEGLNAYCDVPWHRWKATLRHDYFSSPWRVASTSAAVILLLLTLLQTIFQACLLSKYFC